MKKFIFDRLVDRENICNMQKERLLLSKHIKQKANVVIFAPRNYGKTSLLKNVVIEDFKKEHKKSFVFFVDLFGVKDMESLVNRLINAFEHSFSQSFPVKNLLQEVKTFLTNLKPEISMDSLSGSPSISLGLSPQRKEYSIEYIFQLIDGIAKKIPALIVIDEFQDIVAVEESQAIFRTVFQNMQVIPTILMGSKRHILNDIFSKTDAPFALWGIGLQIPPIPYSEYQHYIQERFQPSGLILNEPESVYLQDLVYRVPEAINIICQHLIEMYSHTDITKEFIRNALKETIENREGRFEAQLFSYSKAEETILIELAKAGYISQPQSKSFLAKVKLSNRTVGKIFSEFMDAGVIEKVERQYRISNPLLGFYLKFYR